MRRCRTVRLHRFWPVILSGLLVQAVPCAGQEAIKDRLQGIYNQTMASMRTAKTRADIERIVSETDMLVTTHIGEDGHVSTMARAQTVRELEGVFAQPKRETWNVKVIWASRDHDRAIAVGWVYTKSDTAHAKGEDAKSSGHPVVFGTIIRDNWVLTKDGWRRSSREKISPDRVLIGVGEDTILPQ
ncbi:MAG TPA: hypothetical protein VG206_12865 [Terriglobia bacterium]|nr:hypothetical protein [Terriglobia bacterium]